jgi:hypothetical protein
VTTKEFLEALFAAFAEKIGAKKSKKSSSIFCFWPILCMRFFEKKLGSEFCDFFELKFCFFNWQ